MNCFKHAVTSRLADKDRRAHMNNIAKNQGHFEPANNYQRYIVLHSGTVEELRIARKVNMAAITARSAKKRVSHHDLHNLSTTDLLFNKKKTKGRPASKSLGFFGAKR